MSATAATPAPLIPVEPLGALSSAKTIAAYDMLACEYDDPAHATTRELERLSMIAFRSLDPKALTLCEHPALLELGAGRGALTAQIIALGGWKELLVSDPARAMYAELSRRFSDVPGLAVSSGTAESMLEASGSRFDVIVAGLADPFLNQSTLELGRAHMQAGSVFFATVPSRRWAHNEREHRLGIGVDRTRFRLRDGSHVEAASWTYDQGMLDELLWETGFDVLGAGTCTSDAMQSGDPPEVAWVLARAPGSPSGATRRTASTKVRGGASRR
jgi:hypothetical protein